MLNPLVNGTASIVSSLGLLRPLLSSVGRMDKMGDDKKSWLQRHASEQRRAAELDEIEL